MKNVYIRQQKKDISKINSVKQQIPTLIAINEIYGQVAVIKRPVKQFSCTKEEIDRKRREAMARRQMSQSQARR